MARDRISIATLLLAAVVCVPAVRAADLILPPDRVERFSELGELGSQINELMAVCDSDKWFRVQPSGASPFTLRCVAGQLHIKFPECGGLNAGFEERVAVATAARRFAYTILVPEVGCQTFVMLTRDAGPDLVERTLGLLGSVLRVHMHQTTIVSEESYASTR